MPKSWYIYSENKIDYDNNTPEEIEQKKFYQRICAHKKPYFFSYNYSYLRKEYNDYITNINAKSCSMFQLDYIKLKNKAGKTDKERQFIQWAENKMPLDMSPSVMNKLCNMVENELDGLSQPRQEHFDPSMIKSGYKYLHTTYKSIEQLYRQYKAQISEVTKKKKCEYYLRYENDDDEGYQDVDQIKADFAEKCEVLCPNRHELCDILIDLCYTGRASKDIVWDICGDTIIENLLKNNNYNLYYPEKVTSEEEFECCGSKFIMKKIKFGGDIE